MSNPKKITIINTRPAHQALNLTNYLKEQNIAVIDFPLIEIKGINVSHDILISAIKNCELIIFISVNSVTHFYSQIEGLNLPSNYQVAAIGEATANAYKKISGQCVDIRPIQTQDSEGLLANPQLYNIESKDILIVKGEGGREHLANALKDKGAKVSYLDLYSRQLPSITKSDIARVWKNNKIDSLLVFSSESLSNLLHFTSLELSSRILSTGLIVIHQKIKEKAIKLGFNGVIKIIPANKPNELLAYIKQLAQ